MPAKSSADPAIFKFTVTLIDIDPPIWRTVEVPAGMKLSTFHTVIQLAMGWHNSHLHEFRIGEERYAEPNPFDDDDSGVRDSNAVTLADLFKAPGDEAEYTYDFGDGWMHAIQLEAIEQPAPDAVYPRCVAGERNCPPEDSGGIPGYFELVEAMANPRRRRYKELTEWLGGPFDPEEFSLTAVNRALSRLAPRKKRSK